MSDITPKVIFEQKLPEKLNASPEKVEGMIANYIFDITGDTGGKWTLNCDGSAAVVTEGEQGEAQCTITMTDTDFVAMMDGELNPMMAFSMGKLRVAGDIGLAIKIQGLLT
jgi:putative sterol carrier protein